MLTKAKVKKLKRLIENYAQASVQHSWGGKEDAEDQKIIKQRYIERRKKLNDYLKSITQEEKNESKSCDTVTTKITNCAGSHSD